MVVGNAILDPVLSPLLDLPALVSIIVISFVISLIINLVYKFVTDQKKMKGFKDEIKSYQEKIKKSKSDPKKMMEIQKKAMEKNMQYMKHSLKPTLFTMLPILFIFGWLNANMVYDPLTPGEAFDVKVILENSYSNITLTSTPELEYVSQPRLSDDGKIVNWTLRGKEGDYLLEFEQDGRIYQKAIIITEGRRYSQPVEKIGDSFISKIEINNQPKVYLNMGSWKIGWFGTYIIFSLIFSTLLRKLLKIY
jgi:uncharacterized membrane protein (DUF106 family)